MFIHCVARALRIRLFVSVKVPHPRSVDSVAAAALDIGKVERDIFSITQGDRLEHCVQDDSARSPPSLPSPVTVKLPEVLMITMPERAPSQERLSKVMSSPIPNAPEPMISTGTPLPVSRIPSAIERVPWPPKVQRPRTIARGVPDIQDSEIEIPRAIGDLARRAQPDRSMVVFPPTEKRPEKLSRSIPCVGTIV